MRATIEKYENRKTEERIRQITTNKANINPHTIWETKNQNRQQSSIRNNNGRGNRPVRPPKDKRTHSRLLRKPVSGTTRDPWIWNMDKPHRRDSGKGPTSSRPTGEETRKYNIQRANKAIKKLKRKKSLGPDEIPNETFVEANKDTREIFRTALNRIHE